MFSSPSRTLVIAAALAALGACSKPAEKTAQTPVINPSEVPPPAPAAPVVAATPPAAAPAPPVESESARRARVEREELEAERAAVAQARARVAEIESNSARTQAAAAGAGGDRVRERAAEAQALAEENAYLQGQIDAARQATAYQQPQVLVAPGFAGAGRGHHKPPPLPRDEGRTPIVGNPPRALQPFTALPGGSFSPAIRGEKRDTEQR